MDGVHPAGHSGYGFRGLLVEPDPARVLRALFAPLAERCGGVVEFGDPASSERDRKGDLTKMMAVHERQGTENYLGATYKDGTSLNVYRYDRQPAKVRHTDPIPYGCRPALYGPYLEGVILPWLRDSLASGLAFEGHVVRVATGVTVCAYAPIAAYCQVVITTRAAVEAAYEDPSVFWSMFPGVEEFGERLLLTRHLDEHTDDVYFPHAWRESWALARVAKPKQNRFTGFRLQDWNRSLYFAGEDTLHFAGYHPEKLDVEYTGVLGPDEHVHGREIHGLRRLVQLKKLPDGRPCESVRVVFSDEATARREKRPILDVGASVGFIDRDGKLVLVDEHDRAGRRECELQGTLWR